MTIYFFMFGKNLSAENVASIKMNIYVKKIKKIKLKKNRVFELLSGKLDCFKVCSEMSLIACS